MKPAGSSSSAERSPVRTPAKPPAAAEPPVESTLSRAQNREKECLSAAGSPGVWRWCTVQRSLAKGFSARCTDEQVLFGHLGSGRRGLWEVGALAREWSDLRGVYSLTANVLGEGLLLGV